MAETEKNVDSLDCPMQFILQTAQSYLLFSTGAAMLKADTLYHKASAKNVYSNHLIPGYASLSAVILFGTVPKKGVGCSKKGSYQACATAAGSIPSAASSCYTPPTSLIHNLHFYTSLHFLSIYTSLLPMGCTFECAHVLDLILHWWPHHTKMKLNMILLLHQDAFLWFYQYTHVLP